MLEEVLTPYRERLFAALRIVAGLLFVFHGVQKVFGVLFPFQPAIGSQLWFAGVIETVCGMAILVGLFTTWAAFIASGEMAFAYFLGHWRLQFNDQFFPPVNGGEPAVLYCFLFLYIAARGSGPLSLDAWRRSRPEPRPQPGASTAGL